MIENFFLKSAGEWKSMRSAHSLAFQEFEEIRSKLNIVPISEDDSRVIKLLNDNLIPKNEIKSPFKISWEAKSEWPEETSDKNSSGESILIPIEISKENGKIIRSLGYSEAIQVTSQYKFLNDETLIISSKYNNIITEERIWFISNNLRSRSSVTRSSSSLAILQTSYASEIRYIKNN